MSEFYGKVIGSAQTVASRVGSQDIRVSAQSWHGSVIVRMYYDLNDELNVDIEIDERLSMYGQSYFSGTFEELKEQLQKGRCEE